MGQGLAQGEDRDFGAMAAGGAIAWPAPLLRAGTSVSRRPPSLDLVVDLGDQLGSPRWWRGAVTLGAMIAALVHVAPGPRPDPVVRPHPASVVRHGVAWAPTASAAVPAPMPVPAVAAPAVAVSAVAAPVHLTGIVAGNLYRSLVAAGATPSVAADYIAAIGTRFDVGTIAPGDRFDLVASRGAGPLLYAGIRHGGEPLGLMRWTLGGREQWLDAAGTGAPSDGFIVPVADARLSSGFGMRFHPILGFSRMHQGIDLAAPAGTPIMAAAEGIVRFAGGHGGYGNFVQIQHNGGMGSGYGHMADIVVQPGERVRQGQVIGHVGSTGLSTGPHCHFEIYRDGMAIDPTTANHAVSAQLDGEDLAQFRIALARLIAVPRSS